jgi:hypothetical protein
MIASEEPWRLGSSQEIAWRMTISQHEGKDDSLDACYA